MSSTNLTAVRIYCFRGHGYFGFGLTPQQALASAEAAGCSKKQLKDGFVVVLPSGITSYSIDGEGHVKWEGGSIKTGYLSRWDRNKKTKAWNREVTIRDEDLTTPAAFLDI